MRTKDLVYCLPFSVVQTSKVCRYRVCSDKQIDANASNLDVQTQS